MSKPEAEVSKAEFYAVVNEGLAVAEAHASVAKRCIQLGAYHIAEIALKDSAYALNETISRMRELNARRFT